MMAAAYLTATSKYHLTVAFLPHPSSTVAVSAAAFCASASLGYFFTNSSISVSAIHD
eukprot:CAMPEP_0175018830 /NCGR_PEP_ID=MMETSP0005-20121125/13211_1 /TAXON_ID=420556 /ORGANISM="Ochromonas sp., Strain CCMP1393" /LENGTH=56 /DNA_ID=CAMNT_0016276479 /DNA_START=161 /DNA_END=331 /DNA_ORIENTATION=+